MQQTGENAYKNNKANTFNKRQKHDLSSTAKCLTIRKKSALCLQLEEFFLQELITRIKTVIFGKIFNHTLEVIFLKSTYHVCQFHEGFTYTFIQMLFFRKLDWINQVFKLVCGF